MSIARGCDSKTRRLLAFWWTQAIRDTFDRLTTACWAISIIRVFTPRLDITASCSADPRCRPIVLRPSVKTMWLRSAARWTGDRASHDRHAFIATARAAAAHVYPDMIVRLLHKPPCPISTEETAACRNIAGLVRIKPRKPRRAAHGSEQITLIIPTSALAD